MWVVLDLIAFFKSSHKFLTGLRTGLWLTNSRILLFLSYTCVSLAQQSSLCCARKTNLLLSGRFLADCIRFSYRISLYFADFISPSTLTSLLQRSEPHCMMLPPPCFTVEMVFLWWYAVFCLHQMWCKVLWLWNLLPADFRVSHVPSGRLLPRCHVNYFQECAFMCCLHAIT